MLAYHDANECEVLARDLESFMYRRVLEGLAFNDVRECRVAPEQERQDLRADVDVLRPYLRPAWIADLDAIVAREPRAWSYKLPRRDETIVSRLEQHELDRRLACDLAFAHSKTRFAHMKPVPGSRAT